MAKREPKVTVDQIRNMAAGHILVVPCETNDQLLSAKRIAYYVRDTYKRPDGFVYSITTSSRMMAVSIRTMLPTD